MKGEITGPATWKEWPVIVNFVWLCLCVCGSSVDIFAFSKVTEVDRDTCSLVVSAFLEQTALCAPAIVASSLHSLLSIGPNLGLSCLIANLTT
jgi:hypothetical protein